MTDPTESSAWYDAHAHELAETYEAHDAAGLHEWLTDLLPGTAALVLDVGAGTGRDAAWLSRLGHDIVAIEPSAGMRSVAQQRHQESNIRWLDDRLPGLVAIHQLNLTFDFILLSAVWQHVPQAERPRAMRKLVGLMKPGGVLAITLRNGPPGAAGAMYPVPLAELERLARDHGFLTARAVEMSDKQGRADVSWTGLALRLPDDGTGALPLLRHIILNDQKSATYKLGLLRALCRAADGQAGMAEEAQDGLIRLPLGLIALNWLRLYLPLVEAKLPQAPTNSGPDRLGFVGPGFRKLLEGFVPRLDLRIGARFSGAQGHAVRAALQEASDLIAKMPAQYMTYPNDGGAVLPTRRRSAPQTIGEIAINAEFLAGFGELHVPQNLWRALARFSVWIEPALIAEWARLMREYARRQGRMVDESCMGAAMTWTEQARDTALPRLQALQLIDRDEPLYCVWSGRRLDSTTLDIDHCLPWSVWPCGDLWNLLPSHRQVNQHQKADRLPTEGRLRDAAQPILLWWQRAYLDVSSDHLAQRFRDEARASLPGLAAFSSPLAPPEVFSALLIQRLRLKHDQQVPEWIA